MITFNGLESEKARLLARVTAHEEADDIRRGHYVPPSSYGQGYCAVGCLARDSGDVSPPSAEATAIAMGSNWSVEHWHAELQLQWGIPAELAALADHIHESLTLYECKSWPRQFVEALPVGVDLSSMALVGYDTSFEAETVDGMIQRLLVDLAESA